MKSLFFKIFLWFWLANTVVLAALALAIWFNPNVLGPREGGPGGNLHSLQIRGAFAVWELRGPDAFDRHRRELEAASRNNTFWLNDRGEDIGGWTVPAHMLALVSRHDLAASRGETTRLSTSDGRPILIVPLAGRDGRSYRAVAERFEGPHGPPPDPYSALVFEPGVFIPRLLVVVLTAGLGCWALARYLTSPVRRLRHVARQLASGDLSVRVDSRLTSRRDEIGQLGRDFDSMTRQVQALLTMQKRLLQDVSHELRSPLSRLNVALELARADSAPAAAPALDRVELEADKLSQLVRQLLTVSRLDAGMTPAPRATVDLLALVRGVVDDANFESSATNRRVRIDQAHACWVSGDPDLLRSAVENIVRNAAYYTAEHTEVEVSLQAVGPDAAAAAGSVPVAWLRIRDHGPGVPIDSLESIFRPFHRVSDARETDSGGVGLGLAITQRAIHWHGGTISVHNAVGGGLVVDVRLPCVPHVQCETWS